MGKLAGWVPDYVRDVASYRGRGDHSRPHADDPVLRIVELAIFAVRAYVEAQWGELLHCFAAIAQTLPDLPPDFPIDREALRLVKSTRPSLDRLRCVLNKRMRDYAQGLPVRHLALDHQPDAADVGSSIGLPIAAAPSTMRAHTGASARPSP